MAWAGWMGQINNEIWYVWERGGGRQGDSTVGGRVDTSSPRAWQTYHVHTSTYTVPCSTIYQFLCQGGRLNVISLPKQKKKKFCLYFQTTRSIRYVRRYQDYFHKWGHRFRVIISIRSNKSSKQTSPPQWTYSQITSEQKKASNLAEP